MAAVCGVVACTRPAERPPSETRTAPALGAGAPSQDRAYEFTVDSLKYTARRYRSTAPSGQYGLTVVARYRNLRRAAVALTRCFPEDRTPLDGVRDASADTAGGRAAGAAYDLMWGCVGVRENLVVAAGASLLTRRSLAPHVGCNARLGFNRYGPDTSVTDQSKDIGNT